MRRIFLFCFVLISMYAVYSDVTKGSLPIKPVPETTQAKEVIQDTSFYEQKVEPGDTVLGIIEKNEQTLPASIEQIIDDFKTLNNGLEPGQIKIGLTYKFKRYH